MELDVYFAKPNGHLSASCEAGLDTQADCNLISGNLVDYLGYKIRPYEGRYFESAHGRLTPVGEVSIYFRMQRLRKMRKKIFLVFQNPPYDLILGINFIEESEMYVNGKILVLRLARESSGMFSIHAAASNVLALFWVFYFKFKAS